MGQSYNLTHHEYQSPSFFLMGTFQRVKSVTIKMSKYLNCCFEILFLYIAIAVFSGRRATTKSIMIVIVDFTSVRHSQN